jgi:hypothetical protein
MYIVALLLVYIEIQILKNLPSDTISFSSLCKGDKDLPIIASRGWGLMPERQQALSLSLSLFHAWFVSGINNVQCTIGINHVHVRQHKEYHTVQYISV